MDGVQPRYADCPTVEVQAVVDASAQAVWPLIADIELPARFSAEFQGAKWLDGATGPAVGARFRGRNEHPVVGSWETVCTVVECEPAHKIGYVVNGIERPAATWRYVLEPMAGEQVLLRYWVRIGPGPSLLNGVIDADPAAERRIVAARLADLHRNMTATVLGIKSLAEQRRADMLSES